MNLEEKDKGIALICDPSGAILRVIRDEIGLLNPLLPGTAFINLMDKSSVAEAGKFLAVLIERHAAFDWELLMSVSASPTPMHFVGAVMDDTLLIVGARSSSELVRFSEDLMSINNEQTTSLRAALKDLSLQTRRQPAQDNHLYEDLSRVNNELANLQREMVKKNVELNKLNEEKNRFLGMAAHDLRNPLGIILAYSKFLETEAADVLNEEQREFVATIKNTSKFMLEMVTDLLDVTAIEAGHLKLDRHVADLTELVRRNVTLNRVLSAKKDISIEFEPRPALKFAFDSVKIEQVLNNLITNAIKFSHRGTKVRVTLTPLSDFVTVAVQDQGQGIPAADLSKLFQPFSKTSVRSTAGEKSTGLGLAIARRIVEGHHGRIWVESEVGKGATFFFTLARAVAAADQPAG